MTESFDNLHLAAAAEAMGMDVLAEVTRLLSEGHDPHAVDGNDETAFNIAAANAPKTGRLLTLHWLEQALAGQGSRGLNGISGNRHSSLAQYMAKWLHDDELTEVVTRAVDAGMKIDTANSAGWTALTAAAAMGCVGAVEIFTAGYSQKALFTQTTEEYTARYDGIPVCYARGLNAMEVAIARLQQDEGLSEDLATDIWRSAEIIGGAIKKDRL